MIRQQVRRRGAMALSALVLAGAVSAACTKDILEGLASGFFTLAVAPASVSLPPSPDQGACGTADHVRIFLTQGVGAGDNEIHYRISGSAPGVGLTVCRSTLQADSPEIDYSGTAVLRDGETRRIDLIFRPTAAAPPGAYAIEILASESADLSSFDDIQRDTVVLTILPPVAPTVSIATPADGSTVTATTVALAGTADDDVGVESLAYRLNGGAQQNMTLPAPITDWTFDVPNLTPGPNVIDVLARDGAGLIGTASVTITYDAGTPQVMCGQVLESVLAAGEIGMYAMGVPAADYVYALRVEGDSDGSYEVLTDAVPRFSGVVGPGAVADVLALREPGIVYTATVTAGGAGGTYRLSLVCERPLVFGTNIQVSQVGGLFQLYRFDGPAAPIHIGLHQAAAQVVNPLAVNAWHPGGSIYLNPVGNPAGGYAAGDMVHEIFDVGSPHTVIWEALGFSPEDVDEYSFAISTVTDPVALVLNASGSATATGEVEHLGHLAYFSFAGVGGESYTVTLDHPSGSLAAEALVERLDPADPFYRSSYAAVSSGATTRSERSVTLGPFALPADGTYVIRVGANAALGYDAALDETMGAYRVVLARQ